MQTEVEVFLLQEWLAISQAPISFMAAMIVAAALLWLVMQWAFGVRVDNLRSALEAKEEEIALLDTKIRETRRAFEAAPRQVDTLSKLGPVPIVDVTLGDASNCSVVGAIEAKGTLE